MLAVPAATPPQWDLIGYACIEIYGQDKSNLEITTTVLNLVFGTNRLCPKNLSDSLGWRHGMEVSLLCDFAVQKHHWPCQFLNPLSSRFHCPDHLKRRKGAPEANTLATKWWRWNSDQRPKSHKFRAERSLNPAVRVLYVLFSFLKMICEQWWICKLVADVLFPILLEDGLKTSTQHYS